MGLEFLPMVPIVLSGGSGTRLWPVSRESYPKQFAEFFDHSFLRQTLDRVKNLGSPRVVTLESMRGMTERTLVETGLERSAVLAEPYGKNTAPAVALLTHVLLNEGVKPQTVIGVFPADHLITNEAEFLASMRQAEKLAAGRNIVMFGIKPNAASTGYGYIHRLADGAVERFYEKPDAERAEKFFRSRDFFWNSGIFYFRLDHLGELFAQYLPEIWHKIRSIKPDLSNLKYIYANIESKSLDHGLLEVLSDKDRADMICIPANFGWSDVGSWDELARLQEENVPIDSKAMVFRQESLQNFVYSPQAKTVALCGVENLIVVDTADALLVARRGQSQKVKDLVASIREARLPVADEHRFEVRPWGGFDILLDDERFKVKRLTIDVGARMSFQVHARRDEHWVVVDGEAEILLEDHSKKLKAGDSFTARRRQKHRIRNAGSGPLVIIEVQTGEYFGEDDIVRIEDDYNRS